MGKRVKNVSKWFNNQEPGGGGDNLGAVESNRTFVRNGRERG